MSFIRARVIATFMRPRSRRNPMSPLALLRTGEITITSRSTLKTVDGINRNQLSKLLGPRFVLYERTQISHLCAIWRNDAEVDALVDNPVYADAIDVGIDSVDS